MTSRRIPNVLAFLMMTIGPSLTLYARSAQQHRSPMARMQAVFAAARPAKVAELTAIWVLVTQVTSQPFIDGQDGPDHVLHNETGIRNADVARKVKRPDSNRPQQLWWTLTFRRAADRVQAVSEGPMWPTPRGDVEDVSFDANGDFEFAPDYGAEGDFTYRCRMESAARIICLYKKGGGDSLEFQKARISYSH